MELFSLSILLTLFFLIYFAPSAIGYMQAHHKRLAIFELNLCLGWTVLGWVASIVWACTPARPRAEPEAPRRTRGFNVVMPGRMTTRDDVYVVRRELSRWGWTFLALFFVFNVLMFSGCKAFALYWLLSNPGDPGPGLVASNCGITAAVGSIGAGIILLVWGCGSAVLGLGVEFSGRRPARTQSRMPSPRPDARHHTLS